ncbi:MAG: hypothetical protein ACE5G0_13835 [Rhodothermales bacterium]
MDTQDIKDLLTEIEDLRARLKEEEVENAMLRRLLFSQYAKQPRLMKPLDLPISERAIVLFEVLPGTFDLEEVLATAEKLDLTESEAAEHVRTYLQEGMLLEEDEGKHFVKTGYRPYL